MQTLKCILLLCFICSSPMFESNIYFIFWFLEDALPRSPVRCHTLKEMFSAGLSVFPSTNFPLVLLIVVLWQIVPFQSGQSVLKPIHLVLLGFMCSRTTCIKRCNMLITLLERWQFFSDGVTT